MRGSAASKFKKRLSPANWLPPEREDTSNTFVVLPPNGSMGAYTWAYLTWLIDMVAATSGTRIKPPACVNPGNFR